MWLHVVWSMITDVSEDCTLHIQHRRLSQAGSKHSRSAVRSSEISVKFYHTTRRHIPGDNTLQY
jgi:hypothetical protein